VAVSASGSRNITIRYLVIPQTIGIKAMGDYLVTGTL